MPEVIKTYRQEISGALRLILDISRPKIRLSPKVLIVYTFLKWIQWL